MREIKFRYIFQDDSGKFHTLTINIETIEFHNDITTNLAAGWKLVSRSEFTDLLDKNGKEVFEGDIVIGGIVYRASDGAWRVWNKTYGTTVTLWSFAEDTEVIGNVYEDSQPLEVKSG